MKTCPLMAATGHAGTTGECFGRNCAWWLRLDGAPGGGICAVTAAGVWCLGPNYLGTGRKVDREQANQVA
jgi:hypothetical protein